MCMFLNMHICISIFYEKRVYIYVYLCRRLFAAMLSRHRKKNAVLSKELCIPIDEEEARDMA